MIKKIPGYLRNIKESKKKSSSSTGSVNRDDVIFNSSNRMLTPGEKDIFANGSTSHSHKRNSTIVTFSCPLNIYTDNSNVKQFARTPVLLMIFSKTKLKDIALPSYQNYSPPNFLLIREDYQLLKNLRDDRRIVIMKSDKGNGMVGDISPGCMKFWLIQPNSNRCHPTYSNIPSTRRINVDVFSGTSRRIMLYPKKRMNI